MKLIDLLLIPSLNAGLRAGKRRSRICGLHCAEKCLAVFCVHEIIAVLTWTTMPAAVPEQGQAPSREDAPTELSLHFLRLRHNKGSIPALE
jgi:hypothetical protein